MSKPKSIEFNTRSFQGPQEGVSFDVAVVTNLPELDNNPIEALRIDGAIEDVPSQSLLALSRALIRIKHLIDSKAYVRIDCNTFGILLCGGNIAPEIYETKQYPYTITSKYRSLAPVTDTGMEHPVLEPAVFGDTRGYSIECSAHGYRISDNPNLYLQKFGDSFFGITDKLIIAKIYGSTVTGASLSYHMHNAIGEAMFEYNAPDVETCQPEAIVTTHLSGVATT